MIITQFRKFDPINILWLGVLGFLLCLPAFFYLPYESTVVLFEPIVSKLFNFSASFGFSSKLNILLALGISVFQALYLNRVMNRYNFFPRPNFLIALLYITLASLTSPFLVLSPILLCNFIFIWMIDKLLGLYHKSAILMDMYDLGLIIALGSLIYFPFVVLITAVWVSLSLFRAFNWREWIAPVFGFLTVYFLLWVYYFWNGINVDFFNNWKAVISPVAALDTINQYDLLILIPVFVILVLFFVTLKETIFKRIVYIRKIMLLLFAMLFVSICAFFLDKEQHATHFLLLIPPLSIYMAYFFNYAQQKWVFETVYLLFISMILILSLI